MSGAVDAFARPVTALVTGASRGIGLAFVDRLLADPAVERVVAASRHAARSDALAARLADHGARLDVLDVDVTDEATVERAASRIASLTAQLDLVVNCAGLLHDGDGLEPERRLEQVTAASLQRGFAVNAIGPLLLAKHLHRLLPRRERAVFASLSARVGSIGDNRLGGWYAYRMSKAAQNMGLRNLSIELRRRARGVICVALHPGTVDTGLSRPFQRNVPDGKLFTPERAAAQLLAVIDGLGSGDNGGFFAWDAQPIAW